MNSGEFIIAAKEKIPSRPMGRVSKRVKKVIGNGSCRFDCHVHVFDIKCVPDLLQNFIGNFRSLKKEKFVVDNYLMDDVLSPRISSKNFIFKFLNSFGRWRKYRKDWGEFLAMLGKNTTMENNLDTFYGNYGLKQYTQDEKTTVCTPLMMDLEIGWGANGTNKGFKNIGLQSGELRGLMPRYDILPFYAVDPNQAPLLYQRFIDAFTGENPCFGVKVYPALGYLPSDPRLMPIFEVCEALGIPVTAHCGANLITTRVKNLVLQGLDENLSPIGSHTLPGWVKTYKDRANYLNMPKLWLPVLKKHKNLRLNFAHFGGNDHWKKSGFIKHLGEPFNEKYVIDHFKDKNAIEDVLWVLKFIEDYENVYTDFSFNLKTRRSVRNLKLVYDSNDKVKERLIYGTDFHVATNMNNLQRDIRYFIDIFGREFDRISMENPKRFLGL